MAGSDVVIKIDGDIQQYLDKLGQIQKKNEKSNESFKALAKGGAIAFAGLTTALGLAVNEAAKFETIEVQFQTLTGSVKTATKVVKDLQTFAANTPFQFEGIAKTGQQLLAFGFTADEMQEKLRRIGDVSAATGKPMQELGQIFGQIAAQGKLTGERFNQLQEAGVPIGKALADSMGVAETAIRDLVSKGEVDFATFEDAFNSLSDEGGIAFGAMEKRSQTLEGKISTLKDNISLFAVTIGKQLFPIIKGAVDRFTNFIKKVNESGEALNFFRDIITFTLKAASVLTNTMQSLGAVIGGSLATGIAAASEALKGNFAQAKQIVIDGADGIKQELIKNNQDINKELEQIDKDAAESRAGIREEANEREIASETDQAERLAQMRMEREQARKEREEARRQERIAKKNEEFEEDLARLKDQSTIESEAKKEFRLEEARAERQERKRFIKEEKKHGKAVAAINQAMRSAEYQGTKQAFGDLEQLTQSSNSKLKSIGKAAAVANIVIKTAESAMNIFNGFSTIPIIGPTLGVAGAAAAVAFGVEQVGKVNAANDGGMIGGNMMSANRDSVLSYLTPGEFVTPRQSYNETVEAVADKRIKEREGGATGGFTIGVNYESEEAEKIITIQQNEAIFLGTSRSIA